MRARLLCDYRTPYANPIRLQPGQVVALGVRDEEWPAFAWVSVDGGQAGWAPVDWLRPLGDGRAEALRAYDARELEADRGDAVTPVLARGPLPELTRALMAEHGTERVVDMRRPRTADPDAGRWLPGALPGFGALLFFSLD